MHRFVKTAMFKIIHTLVHRFPLVVDSISFVLYDCWYSIPICVHKLSTHLLAEVWPILLWQKTQAGTSWLVSRPSFGPSSPVINSQWDSGQDSDYATPGR